LSPVRPLAAGELDEVVAVAARAFWPDPLLGFFSRGLLHEHRHSTKFFQADLRDRRAYAEVSVVERDGRIGAVACWAPPGSLPRSPVQRARTTLRASRVLVNSRNRAKAVRLLDAVERRHPTEPHWYLALLGTDPAYQGRGLGSELLAPVLARCDAEGLLAYTETQKEANVSWYARAGFTVADEVRLPGTPPVWLLRRDP
jgi:ribosomal protein S18 acetylase RimI-like enzyme